MSAPLPKPKVWPGPDRGEGRATDMGCPHAGAQTRSRRGAARGRARPGGAAPRSDVARPPQAQGAGCSRRRARPPGERARATMKHSEHLADLLDVSVEFLRDYVVMSAAQADAAALWAAHTHALDAFETTPFLAVTSPEKRCGKTRLLDALELVVARPWRTIMPSEAVLFRKIEAVAPTLMLDETDAVFDKSNGSTEPLRALLNAGNRRGTSVPRCVGPRSTRRFLDVRAEGSGGHRRQSSRHLSQTARSSSGWRASARTSWLVAFDGARRWSRQSRFNRNLRPGRRTRSRTLRPRGQAFRSALGDRAEEAWEPLFAISDLAGGSWPERARRAALELSASDEAEDEALGPWLCVALGTSSPSEESIDSRPLTSPRASPRSRCHRGAILWGGRSTRVRSRGVSGRSRSRPASSSSRTERRPVAIASTTSKIRSPVTWADLRR